MSSTLVTSWFTTAGMQIGSIFLPRSIKSHMELNQLYQLSNPAIINLLSIPTNLNFPTTLEDGINFVTNAKKKHAKSWNHHKSTIHQAHSIPHVSGFSPHEFPVAPLGLRLGQQCLQSQHGVGIHSPLPQQHGSTFFRWDRW